MKAQEFYNEVISSPICPDDFPKIYADFCRYQKHAEDTLAEFHRICEKNGVEYQLAYGSLLGAVRDGGQIPWDYDVDVFVPFDEKQRLLSALESDLDEGYYYYCPEKDAACRHVFVRVAPKGFRTEALHVDVFFLIGMPEDEQERRRFAEEVFEVSQARFDKLVNIREESGRDLRRFAKLVLNRIKVFFRSKESIEARYNALCEMYPYSQAETVGDASIFIKKLRFPKAFVGETTLCKTEKGEYRVPVEYDKVLTMIYGDYKKVPPLESRLKELIGHYNYCKRYEGKK